ncbi:MAG: lipocalin family protein [Flavipsychrobacter sp.]
MKLNKLLIVGCLSIAAFSIASCKKSSSSSTKDMLVGTWTQTMSGYDANNNNVVDAGETTADNSGTVTFNKDNTGTISGSGLSFPMTYSLNDKNLSVYVAGDTTNLLITSISSSSLTVKDPSDSTFEVFKK